MPTPPKSGTDWLKQQRASAAAGASSASPTCNNEDSLDSRVEQFLQQHGVKYAKKTMIPIEMIDERASIGIQARDVPTVKDAVDRYATALRNNEYLPPIIVFPVGNKVRIISGNNRHGAHKRVGSRFIPGYVIDAGTSSEMIQLLTVAANRENAESVSLRWRKVQAVGLIGIGYTAEVACEAAGITTTQLTEYRALVNADAKAKKHGVRGFGDLSETARIAIGRVQLDSVFYQAARAAVEFKVDSDTAKRLLREVKALSSESEQLAYVLAFGDEQREKRALEGANDGKKKSASVSSPKTALTSSGGKICNISNSALVRQVLTESDRDALVRWCERIAQKVVDIQIDLEALRFDADGEEVRRAG